MFKKIVLVIFCLGFFLVILGLVLAKGDFNKIKNAFVNDDDYEFQTVSGDDLITAVDIDVNDNNVKFFKSDDETYKLEYYTSKNDQIRTNIKNGTLEMIGERKGWFSIFNWRIKSSKVSQINIYLPNSFNGSIKLELSSGNTIIENFELSSLDIDVTSGSLNLKNTKVNSNINFEITSGNINLTNVEASNLFGDATSGSIVIKESTITSNTELEVTSGNIKVIDSSLNKFEAEATSGDITLSNVSANDIVVDITSGNINLKIKGSKDDYRTILDITSGDIFYLGYKNKKVNLNPNAPKYLKARGTSGDIKVDFVN